MPRRNSDRFCEDLNYLVVPINNVDKLRRHVFYLEDKVMGLLIIREEFCMENTNNQFDAIAGRNTPLLDLSFLEDSDDDGPDGDWPFRELAGSVTWLANQTRPHVWNAVRVVTRYAIAIKLKHWKVAKGILGYRRNSAVSLEESLVHFSTLEIYRTAATSTHHDFVREKLHVSCFGRTICTSVRCQL